MRLHKHHIYMHTYTKPRSRKLDVNLGASQVNYITYSIIRFLLFSQFVLTIIFVVSLSSGEKTTGKWGHFTLVNIYICVCTCVTKCVHLCIHICVCYITLRYTSLKMTLRFGKHFRCCAATAPQTQHMHKRSHGSPKRSSGRHKRSSRKTVNAASEDTNAAREKP